MQSTQAALVTRFHKLVHEGGRGREGDAVAPPRRKLGEDCMVKTSCRKSSKVSNSKTESKWRWKPNPPLDSCRHRSRILRRSKDCCLGLTKRGSGLSGSLPRPLRRD